MKNQNSLIVAAIQMVSGPEVDKNLESAEKLAIEAVESGAQLLVFPEYFSFLGLRDTDKLSVQEAAEGSGNKQPMQGFLRRLATSLRVWIIGGTIPLQSDDPQRTYNSCLVYSPSGEQIARYDKIHLFNFQQGDEEYDEARTIKSGAQPIVFKMDSWRVGLSICYDLRFPELYRALAVSNPLDLIVVPAAFTYTTGQAHWELLLRARAIENQCYVLAAAQGGSHPNGRRTWGHSMLIDPWGKIIAVHPEGLGFALGQISLELCHEIRNRLPAWKHRQIKF